MENNGDKLLEPVTAAIVRTVRPGRANEFEVWVDQMRPVVMGFPGYLGTDVIRPRGPANSEYVIVVRFDGYEHLKAFMDSQERAELIKRSELLTVGEPAVQEAHGFTSFFSLPGQPAGPLTPAKYKMAILTLLTLYIPLLGISTLVAMIFRGLPRPLLVLITLVIMVPIMTWYLMPWVTRLFRGWLFPRPK